MIKISLYQRVKNTEGNIQVGQLTACILAALPLGERELSTQLKGISGNSTVTPSSTRSTT